MTHEELADALQSLKINYERYFMGLERIEPLRERQQFKKNLRAMLEQKEVNTAKRYKLQSIKASLITYEAHWDRLCKQIEEGTYKRDVLKAARIKTTSEKISSTSTSTSTSTKTDESETLYQEYLAAQKQLGKTVDISKEALTQSLQKQLATAKERFPNQNVEIKVAIKDGKTVLRVVPK